MKEKRALEWADELESGDAALDNHTRDFLRNANIFFDMMDSMYKEEKLDQTLGILTDYSRNHFSAQEEMMRQTKYPGIAEHMDDHKRFIRAVSKLYKEKLNQRKNLDENDEDFDNRGIAGVINDTYDFIIEWYDSHMLNIDRRFLDYLKYEFKPKDKLSFK